MHTKWTAEIEIHVVEGLAYKLGVLKIEDTWEVDNTANKALDPPPKVVVLDSASNPVLSQSAGVVCTPLTHSVWIPLTCT